MKTVPPSSRGQGNSKDLICELRRDVNKRLFTLDGAQITKGRAPSVYPIDLVNLFCSVADALVTAEWLYC